MHLVGFALVFGAMAAHAQPGVGAFWYRSATGMLGRPPAGVNARDIERMERYLVFGVAGCTGLTPQQIAANQAVARNMSAYLGSVGTAATDPDARVAAVRVAAAFSAFPCAYPGKQMALMAPPPPPRPGDPPFSMIAPNLGKIPDAEQEMAADLVVRYETDAASSAAIWKNAEQLRINLEARGMGMNAQTAAAVGRFKLLYDSAAEALHDHNWDEALSNLQGAEATTQKVASVVGH